jgi:methylase of polypeptide subunit release factors
VDGLACYRVLIPQLVSISKPNALLVLECGDGQAADVVELTKNYGFTQVSCGYDLAGKARCVYAQGRIT